MSYKILVVDDEADLREALTMALNQAGYVVVTAENGTEGLARAEAHRPHLILLDIMMPDMNGHTMLAKLRREPWGKDVPVLMLTNADDAENIVKGVSNRIEDYIIKSQTSLADIVKRVTQYVSGYR